MSFDSLYWLLLETLRKYPSFTFLVRKAKSNYRVDGTDLVIEKGTRLLIPSYAIHMLVPKSIWLYFRLNFSIYFNIRWIHMAVNFKGIPNTTQSQRNSNQTVLAARRQKNVIQWHGLHLVMGQGTVSRCASEWCNCELVLSFCWIALNFHWVQNCKDHQLSMWNHIWQCLKVAFIWN